MGKEPRCPDSDRPIALASHTDILRKRMVVDRLTTDYLDRNKKILPYLSGFRKGRRTMDAVVLLETEIRKGLIKKESLVVVFYVEKTYGMERGRVDNIEKVKNGRKHV